MATVSDTFDTNGSSLGGDWTELRGGSNFEVASQQATRAAGAPIAAYDTAVGATHQVAIDYANMSANLAAGVLVACNGVGTGYACIYQNKASGGTFVIRSVTGGNLDTTHATADLASGRPSSGVMHATFDGATVRFWVNDVLRLSHTISGDGVEYSGDHVGMYGTVNVDLDYFRGAELTQDTLKVYSLGNSVTQDMIVRSGQDTALRELIEDAGTTCDSECFIDHSESMDTLRTKDHTSVTVNTTGGVVPAADKGGGAFDGFGWAERLAANEYDAVTFLPFADSASNTGQDEADAISAFIDEIEAAATAIGVSSPAYYLQQPYPNLAAAGYQTGSTVTGTVQDYLDYINADYSLSSQMEHRFAACDAIAADVTSQTGQQITQIPVLKAFENMIAKGWAIDTGGTQANQASTTSLYRDNTHASNIGRTLALLTAAATITGSPSSSFGSIPSQVITNVGSLPAGFRDDADSAIAAALATGGIRTGVQRNIRTGVRYGLTA